jgi:hypothetical protein
MQLWPTVPVLTALWEKTQVNGRELIATVVAGYEVGYRIADALLGSCRHRFYGSRIKDLFDATVAGEKLLGLDKSAMGNRRMPGEHKEGAQKGQMIFLHLEGSLHPN